MNTAERKALEFLADRTAWAQPWIIPNGRGRNGVTEKTLISLEDSGWARWHLSADDSGWEITPAGRAALREREG